MKLHCASGLFLNLDEPSNIGALSSEAGSWLPSSLAYDQGFRPGLTQGHASAVTLGLHMGLEALLCLWFKRTCEKKET